MDTSRLTCRLQGAYGRSTPPHRERQPDFELIVATRSRLSHPCGLKLTLISPTELIQHGRITPRAMTSNGTMRKNNQVDDQDAASRKSGTSTATQSTALTTNEPRIITSSQRSKSCGNQHASTALQEPLPPGRMAPRATVGRH